MIAIRLSLAALALAALYGLALGIGVALVELAPFVGWALCGAVAAGGVYKLVYGLVGRWLDYRRDVFIAGLQHEERLMLIAAEQRRALGAPVYWIESGAE